MSIIDNIPIALVLIVCACSSCTQSDPKHIENVDQYLLDMMNLHEIPGLGVAIIKEGETIHEGYYGKASVEEDIVLTNKSLFKIYSLTKTFVATSIFQLIEAGEVDIKDNVGQYIEGLPERWHKVSIGNLLSHSSGLPDIRALTDELNDNTISDIELLENLFDTEMDFATGSDWSYNQTNYILLKLIIEKLTKVDFEEFIVDQQLSNARCDKFLFTSQTRDQNPLLAQYYQYDSEKEDYVHKKEFGGEKNYPLAGIALTLRQYIHWNRRLDTNTLMREDTKDLMWTPFNFSNSDRRFLHGWDVYSVNGYDSYGFSGGGVSGFRKFIDKGLTVIVLTTGYKYYAVQDIIIDQLAGMVDESLKDEQSVLTEEVMGAYFLDNSNRDIDDAVTRVKGKYPDINLEAVFKSIGYTLFFQLDRKKEAIRLFELNVEEYPNSYDTHGSLGYLYLLTDQFVLARKYYSNALDLNPENSYSERRITEIDAILDQVKL